MGMQESPSVITMTGAKYWEHEFKNFKAGVYVPDCDMIYDVINFGYKAPYLIVFEEKEQTAEERASFAEKTGLSKIASAKGGSVVFVFPTSGDWDSASDDLFKDLIAESKIHQYYRDGMVTFRDRFTGEYKDFFIRGAIFRTCIYASGKSADYAARNLLKKVEGEYLWGPGDITPACLVLENLSVVPKVERDDIPVLSVGNSTEVNATLENCCKYFRAEKTIDYIKAYEVFTGTFKRWCGDLEIEPDLAREGVVEEPAICEVKTSPDNCGDDKGTERHNVGYIAYYNKDLFDKGPAPLLLAFHGGGDSSLYISFVSGWWKVAHRNNFLLVAIENHLNSTATEMMELIEELKKKYSIDEHRIYATGFSMGGCKSWDMFQEYPKVFAGLAPMDATFEVGLNVFGKPAPVEINHDTPVPVFYAGGEITPLPELPFQAEKCHDRIRYVFEVNKLVTPYNVKYEDRDNWPNKIWGIDGDRVEKFYDETRDSYLTVNYFKDAAGVETTALASISGQGHECREHTCEHAWQFLSKFTR
ncbi:MAG: hypothetical protein K5679_14380 [Lachnospiraceae bacterium]|nr:hypothetical protein [Lachnospiraceae bacterium]